MRDLVDPIARMAYTFKMFSFWRRQFIPKGGPFVWAVIAKNIRLFFDITIYAGDSIVHKREREQKGTLCSFILIGLWGSNPTRLGRDQSQQFYVFFKRKGILNRQLLFLLFLYGTPNMVALQGQICQTIKKIEACVLCKRNIR